MCPFFPPCELFNLVSGLSEAPGIFHCEVPFVSASLWNKFMFLRPSRQHGTVPDLQVFPGPHMHKLWFPIIRHILLRPITSITRPSLRNYNAILLFVYIQRLFTPTLDYTRSRACHVCPSALTQCFRPLNPPAGDAGHPRQAGCGHRPAVRGGDRAQIWLRGGLPQRAHNVVAEDATKGVGPLRRALLLLDG